MIIMRSKLKVADNTGAKAVMMIRRLGQLKDSAGVGDIVVCHVRESSPDASVKKGTVVKCLVVRTKAPIRRADGSYLRFDENAVVILDTAGTNPKGTRVFGPVAREVREISLKTASLAPEVL